MKVLITGVAGFIGYSVAQRLLSDGMQIYGVDNLNNYYDVNLKKARLSNLQSQPSFTFEFLELGDRNSVQQLFQKNTFDYVIHLAAQG
jgi:UDP-glucuronate 4-epimerase